MLDDKELKVLRDLYVKINRIFNTEFYIFPTGYIIDVPQNRRINSTTTLLKLEPGYYDIVLKAYFNNKKNCILHVTNVKLIKDDLFNNFTYIETEPMLSMQYDVLDKMISLYSSVDKWKPFRLSDNDDENEELCVKLFRNNEAIEFKPTRKSDDYVIIGKSLFPIVTDKNYRNNLYYHNIKYNDNINQILFDFDFSHFRIHLSYTYVKLD